MNTRLVCVGARIEPELAAAVARLARDGDRTVSRQIRRAIVEHVATRHDPSLVDVPGVPRAARRSRPLPVRTHHRLGSSGFKALKAALDGWLLKTLEAEVGARPESDRPRAGGGPKDCGRCDLLRDHAALGLRRRPSHVRPDRPPTRSGPAEHPQPKGASGERTRLPRDKRGQQGSSLTGGERLRSPPVNEQLHEALDPLENFRDVDSLRVADATAVVVGDVRIDAEHGVRSPE